MCVVQHLLGPPFTSALDAHATKSSSPGLCARTHTLDIFSSWWGGKPFTVRRARGGNVCRHMSAGPCSKYKIMTFFLCLPTAGRLCLSTACTLCLPTAGRLGLSTAGRLGLSTAGRLSLSAALHSRQTGPVHSRQTALFFSSFFYLPGT